MYKSMVLIGILISCVLIISNTVNPTQAFVIIGMGKTYSLAIISILTGAMIGYGAFGLMNQKPSSDDNGGFDF